MRTIGLGIDLVAVGSVAEALGGEHARHYLERVYTEREVEDCRDPSGEIDPARLAARFAAKEATIKALPGGGEEMRLTSIEVRREPNGEVRLELSGRPAELAAEAGIGLLAVSLTHEGGFAAAAVVAA
jgi:holo-[acyl-carrier protein] synthase